MQSKEPLFLETFPTALGKFSVAINARGGLVAAGFGEKLLLPRRKKFDRISDPKRTARVRRQIEEYLGGRRKNFDLPLALEGSLFQKHVWAALREIPFGQTYSYGQLAKAQGKPGGARAVGQAVGSNPLCLVVPCHRVIASDGSLGGYAFGPKLKQRLLDLEAAR